MVNSKKSKSAMKCLVVSRQQGALTNAQRSQSWECPSNPSRSLGWWPEGVTPTAPVSEARYFHILPASPNMDIYFGADHFGPYPNEDSRHSDGISSKNHDGWFSPATPLIARDLALTAGVQVALVTKGGIKSLKSDEKRSWHEEENPWFRQDAKDTLVQRAFRGASQKWFAASIDLESLVREVWLL